MEKSFNAGTSRRGERDLLGRLLGGLPARQPLAVMFAGDSSATCGRMLFEAFQLFLRPTVIAGGSQAGSVPDWLKLFIRAAARCC